MRTNAWHAENVFRVETDKGEYVAVRAHRRCGCGRPAGGNLPSGYYGLSVSEAYALGAHTQAYARSLRWILALLDDAVVPFTVGPMTSGRETCGHRIHGAGPFAVAHADEFLATLAGPCAIA